MTDRGSQGARARFVGSAAIGRELAQRGLGTAGVDSGLVVDTSAAEPCSWPEVEDELTRIFELTREAIAAGAPVVHVLHGPSLYGHTAPLRTMLATGLLGGVRSLGIEGRRSGLAAHAVVVDGPGQAADAAEAVRWLVGHAAATGQVIHCGTTHVARPPV
jgi:hypothetical protein